MKESIMKSQSVELLQARALIEEARKRIRALDARCATLQQERARIMALPVTREDFVVALLRDIDRKAKRFVRHLAHNMSGPRRLSWEGAKSAGSTDMYYHLGGGSYKQPDGVNEDALYLFLGRDAMRAGIERVVDSMEWAKDAMPTSERLELLGKIDAELQAIGAERAELVESLGAGNE